MYIGLDIGTSSVKALLVSGQGEVLASASQPYPIHATSGFELQPLEVWNAVCSVLSEVASHRFPIRGIGISSLGEAAAVLDEQYEPMMGVSDFYKKIIQGLIIIAAVLFDLRSKAKEQK